MKQHAFYIFAIILPMVFTACGPSAEEISATETQDAANLANTQTAAAPTPTFTPSPTPTPTLTPTNTVVPANLPTSTPAECNGNYLVYNPRVGTESIGEIDGKEFVFNAEELEGASVEVTIDVIEAQHLVLDGGEVDGTLVLVVIEGDDDIWYPATVFFPDSGFGMFQFLHGSIFEVSGIHVGYMTPPENFFSSSSYAHIGQEGYDGPFASMIAVSAKGPC